MTEKARLEEQFREVAARIEQGERYLTDNPNDEKALQLFRDLLQRTAEINAKLRAMGKEPMGISEIEAGPGSNRVDGQDSSEGHERAGSGGQLSEQQEELIERIREVFHGERV